MSFYIKFWGARGSIPTPGSWTRVYGGNTSCVEVRFGNAVFICDAGSGIREMGKDLIERHPRPENLHLLISHTHWDHIQGFPFFMPAYLKHMKIRVYGTHEGDDSRFRILSGQMSSSYFPVSFADLGADIIPDYLIDGHAVIEGVEVDCFPLNHPGGAFGFIFKADGRKIVYATDNEINVQPQDIFPDTTLKGPLRLVASDLLDAVEDADLLITDAQFDDAQYATHKGWGHSSCLSVIDLAIRANVRNLALFHHDPEITDHEIDARVDLCRARAANQKSECVVFAAREGVELRY